MNKYLIKLRNFLSIVQIRLNNKITETQEKCLHPNWTTPKGPNGETIEYSGNCPDCGKYFYAYRW